MERSCCYQWYLFGHFYQSNTLALELVIPGRSCMAFFLLLVLKTNDLPRYQLFTSQSSASSLALKEVSIHGGRALWWVSSELGGRQIRVACAGVLGWLSR